MKALAIGSTIALLASFAQAAGPSTVTSIFRPLSTPAEHVHELSLLVLAICAVIFIIVGGLLAYTVIRFRRGLNDDGGEPPQIYGSNQIELAWTVLPILIVSVLYERLRATADTPSWSDGFRQVYRQRGCGV